MALDASASMTEIQKMNAVAVHLSDEQAERLGEIARYRHASTAAVVQEAVAQYLDQDAEFRAAVQIGIDQADRGELEDFNVVAAELRAMMAARVAAAG